MPDLLIGAPISSADFPPAVWASDTTSNNNQSSTTYIPGTPTVATTFTAPTSGAVLLTVGGAGSDNGGTNAVNIAPEVRVGSVAGAVVLAADVTTRGIGTPGEVANPIYRSRTTLLTGLTPGATYYARAMHRVSGGSTADIPVREIMVTPTPLGSSAAGRPVKALDYPPAVWAQSSTQINNPVVGGYVLGTPSVTVTFTAPTSGRVLLIVGGGAGNSAGADRIFLAPEVRETSSGGALVLAPSAPARGWASDMCASAFTYGSRETVLDGLTPGQVYWAAVKYSVVNDSGPTTADIAAREIVVVPIP